MPANSVSSVRLHRSAHGDAPRMVTDLLDNGQIKTTITRAKEVSPWPRR